MGICPCTRDSERQEIVPVSKCEMESETLDGENEPSRDLHVTLRAKEIIIRLHEPLSARYKIGKTLKTEGVVEMFRATLISSGQDCVIAKIPKRVYHMKTKEALFDRLSKLDHPHLLKTREVCQDGSFLYVVSESYYCSLGDYLSIIGRMTQTQAATTAFQLWNALAYCHYNCVTHKRVSLESVVLKTCPRGEQVDLRLSDLFYAGETTMDFSKSIFSAPEARECSNEGDIWSSGVVLYILLSGRSPFERFSLSPVIKCKGCSFPPAVWESVSEDAMRLIIATLKHRPRDRPSAIECLTHPWVQRFAVIKPASSLRMQKSIRSLRAIRKFKSLKEAVMQLIVSRVLADSEIGRLTESFHSIDSNGDGQISSDELIACLCKVIPVGQSASEMERVFAHSDMNKNGFIEYTEFLLTAFEHRKLLTRENLSKTFATLDRDGRLQVQSARSCAMVLAREGNTLPSARETLWQENTEQRASDTLPRRVRNGRISVQELKHFFYVNSTPGSYLEWRNLVAEFDTSGDGEIDFSEFEAMMTTAYGKVPK